jgi:hypothetical protein
MAYTKKGGWGGRREHSGRKRKDGLPAGLCLRPEQIDGAKTMVEIDRLDAAMSAVGWRLDNETETDVDASIVEALARLNRSWAVKFKQWGEDGKHEPYPAVDLMVAVARIRAAGLRDNPKAWNNPDCPDKFPGSTWLRNSWRRDSDLYGLVNLFRRPLVPDPAAVVVAPAAVAPAAVAPAAVAPAAVAPAAAAPAFLLE